MESKRQCIVLMICFIGIMLLEACAPLRGQAAAVQNTPESSRTAIDAQWMAATQATPLPSQEISLSEPHEFILSDSQQHSWDRFSQLQFAGDWIVGYALKSSSLDAPVPVLGTRVVIAIDPNTGQIRELSDKVGVSLAVSDRYAVWDYCYQNNERYVGDLYAYDLQTHTTSQLPTDNNCPNNINIAGHLAVWDMSFSGSAHDIWGGNLLTGEVFAITELPGYQQFPKTDGNWVIYAETETDQNSHNVSRRLYAYRMKDKKTVMLGEVWYLDEGVLYAYYAINAGRVAWITPENQIHIYDLNTQDEQVLLDLPNRCHPYDMKMSDNFLAFGCGQNMGYDLNQKQFFSIPSVPPTTASYSAERPNFSGERLIWAVNLDNEPHIYTAKILR